MGQYSKFGRPIALFFILVFTCVFCNWPDFHPEEHVGMGYHWQLDMIFHGGYFYIASLLLLWLVPLQWSPMHVCLLLWLFSLLLEMIQVWVPGRSFTLLDIISNTIGISAGWVTHRLLKKH
jgi:hypothetical protein